jgi:hypothetical protein
VILAAAVVACASANIGCGGQEPPPPPATPQTANASQTSPAAQPPAAHEHAAPHGGVLLELGEEFAHLELVIDRATGRLILYVLDGEAEKPVRLEVSEVELAIDPAPSVADTLNIKLAAKSSVLTGETVGDTSQFEGQHEAFKTTGKISGRVLKVSVRGKEFADTPFEIPPAAR